MKITLIRHTSVNVEAGICYGQSNVDVSSSFKEEAEIVSKMLAQYSFDAIFSSPLCRCTKLANYCGYAQPTLDNRLMELNFGEWEMKAWTAITDPHLERWYSDWVNEKTTNGESFAQQIARVQLFLNETQNMDLQHIAVFTHAGVIRALGVILEQFSIQKAFEWPVEYGQIVHFEITKNA